jgi:hypothetical protein
MAPVDVYIRHYVGHCAVCGFPIFDMGNSDELEHDFMSDVTPDGWHIRNDWFFKIFHGEGDI